MNEDWRNAVADVMRRLSPADDTTVRRWEDEQERLRLDSALRLMDLPPRIADDMASPTLNTEREPIPSIARAIEAGQRMILLAGLAGTGKTVAAVWIVHRMRGAYFIRIPYLLELGENHKTAWNAERALLRSALVLDEVGEELDWQRGKVDQILAVRYDMAANCVTVVTTNLELNAFAQRYGERIASRFRDPRYCVIIPCLDVIRPRRGK